MENEPYTKCVIIPFERTHEDMKAHALVQNVPAMKRRLLFWNADANLNIVTKNN